MTPDRVVAGPVVGHFFDNLLPDDERIRRRIGARFRVGSTEAFELLQAIGRDCVGAGRSGRAGDRGRRGGVAGRLPATHRRRHLRRPAAAGRGLGTRPRRGRLNLGRRPPMLSARRRRSRSSGSAPRRRR
ncbi:HipA N-terminal domain-containing protein [Rubrivivax gelatinosus]|uniref:HipA N-terminal domain-containing protein n=1 Tax=Rubrivivax gelatinosus TaxID=28068 RepID=UPI003F79E3EC